MKKSILALSLFTITLAHADVAPETLVHLESLNVPIAFLRIPEEILGFEPSSEARPGLKVTRQSRQTMADTVLKITLSNNQVLKVTPDQVFLDRDMQPASATSLVTGSRVIGGGGALLRVLSIEEVSDKRMYMNLEVEGGSYFVGNGVLLGDSKATE